MHSTTNKRTPSRGSTSRNLLHLKRVDHECVVCLNGCDIGRHQGGNTACTFDAATEVRTDPLSNRTCARPLPRPRPFTPPEPCPALALLLRPTPAPPFSLYAARPRSAPALL